MMTKATSMPPITVSVGEAKNSDGKLLFREEGTVHWNGDSPVRSETLYYDPDGRLIARLDADFTPSLFVPTFRLEDKRDGGWHGCALSGPGLLRVSRGKPGEPTESRELEIGKEPVVAGPGAVFYAREQFEKLKRGEDLKLQVVAPAYLDSFSFTLSRESLDESTLRIELAFRSFFIRLFAPKVRFDFHPDSKNLVGYLGTALIPDDKGNVPAVTVSYRERIPATVP